MLHEPIFSIFMAAVAVAITLIVWNFIANVGPQNVTDSATDSVTGMGRKLQAIPVKRNG
jgi:hypothetical protein